MKKSAPKPAPKKGNASAVEIYLAVGIALTSWEASEDALVGVFRTLCAAKEPTLFVTFISAPRGPRLEMLRLVMKRYSHFFKDDEAPNLLEILKALDRLAQTRNEIAHGYCVDIERSFDGELKMSGFYLLPSLHEGVWLDREHNYRFAHTAETMREFASSVIALKKQIEELMFKLMDRVNANLERESKIISAGIAQQHQEKDK